uniref:Ovule protein n=1 Tax=Echinococcus granulosus TaxID=6210 RepID=A0A068WP99_ECHGR|nr:hypothetical protein EgrG_000477700 [Echinococcus granulosus]
MTGKTFHEVKEKPKVMDIAIPVLLLSPDLQILVSSQQEGQTINKPLRGSPSRKQLSERKCLEKCFLEVAT